MDLFKVPLIVIRGEICVVKVFTLLPNLDFRVAFIWRGGFAAIKINRVGVVLFLRG